MQLNEDNMIHEMDIEEDQGEIDLQCVVIEDLTVVN
jgi:hypothetical protein